MINAVSVIGLGYIGLPTATMFARNKIMVNGVDVNQDVVDIINAGDIHIVEPGLENAVRETVEHGFLKASSQVSPADAFIIAVPTPFKDGFEPDLSYVQSAAAAIAGVLAKGSIVILESTSPVGTTDALAGWLAAARPDLSFPHQVGEEADINIAYCPERVLPGNVMSELIENDRLIGGITPRCSEKCVELYSAFVTGKCLLTDARTAEMAKLTENSFRDVNIAFANELSVLCDKFQIDVWELISLANRHPRVNILKPGAGVGGHCIAVDPWFIVHAGGEEARLIRSAREINDNKTSWVIQRIINLASKFSSEYGRKPVVACMGLAFKPDIDDLRESPALRIYNELLVHDVKALAVEPNLKSHDSIVLTSITEALVAADVFVFLVGHSHFENLEVTGIEIDFCGVRKVQDCR